MALKKIKEEYFISFETPKEKLDPIFKLSKGSIIISFLWMHPDGPKLMHNLGEILILFTTYISSECEKFNHNRIVIDSFSNGFAFWSLQDILKFIDLCRSLPNSENQCLLWTINSA